MMKLKKHSAAKIFVIIALFIFGLFFVKEKLNVKTGYYTGKVKKKELEKAEEMDILAQYDSQSAQGLSFEEMSQAVDAIRQKGISKESERQAVQTIAQMQQTDLFELMIEQIEGGRQRVAEMLNRIEKEVSHEKMDIEEADNVLKQFDLDKYL